MDTEDEIMGEFNLTCYSHILQTLENHSITCISILGSEISKEKVETAITSFQEQSFICIAYSHGTATKLLAEGEEYISIQNAYFFGKSILYTVSCLTGQELGSFLVQNGADAFWGYEEEFHFQKDNEAVFVECANKGIEEYLGGKNISKSFQIAKEYYTECIDKEQDTFAKSRLAANRNAMILLP